ncbi:hypothetical protein [Streptomyces olivaceus]
MCLFIVLFTVAIEPVGFADLLTNVVRGVLAFFDGLRTFLTTIKSP